MDNLENYCKFHKKIYFIDTNGVIYKYIYNRNNFIKLTHWFMGEDRRISIEYLSKKYTNKELKILTSQKANELTNQYWNNLTREWEYDGRKYKVLSIKDALTQNIDPEDDGKLHIFPEEYFRYYVGLYRNRIIWYTYTSYNCSCLIFKFADINKQPSVLNDFCGYISRKGIQPILDCETNEFI